MAFTPKSTVVNRHENLNYAIWDGIDVYKRQVLNMYGNITHVYCDSAEQTLINGLKSAARKNGLGWLRIDDALKEVITERIRLTNRMMAQMRFSYMPEMCDTLVSALCSAIWNPKEITVDERLDDEMCIRDRVNGQKRNVLCVGESAGKRINLNGRSRLVL